MISLVINLDSRSGIDGCQGGTMGDGSRSWDFFTHGVKNKVQFFDGWSGWSALEVILYIDQHLPIPDEVFESIHEILDHPTITKRIFLHKHQEGQKNDGNYLSALREATGDYVAHFDQDVVAFGDASKWIASVLQYKFVSYPCASSPDPDPDRERWQNFRWASTRAFFCKREDLRLDDLERCLDDQQWAYRTFGTPPSCHGWTEHYLVLMAGENQVYYPPLNDDLIIFSWSRYQAGVLAKLNEMSMPEIQQYVKRCGGINWAGELDATLI